MLQIWFRGTIKKSYRIESVQLPTCSRALMSSSCWTGSNSVQQETKEALKRSLASWECRWATFQHARRAGDGEALRSSEQSRLYQSSQSSLETLLDTCKHGFGFEYQLNLGPKICSGQKS